jgi:ribosome biogenesis GTPase A
MVHDALLNSLRILAHLEVLPPSERRLAAETAAKLAEALVYVAVIGEFKRGKSTLINALLGEDVLPTGITPVTAAPTLVRFGPAARAVIYRRDGSAAPVPLAQLPVVEHIAPLLASGLVLADTPGTGSVHRHNTETTTEFFPVSTSPCWCSPSTRRSLRLRPACWLRWAGRPRGWRSASTRRTC